MYVGQRTVTGYSPDYRPPPLSALFPYTTLFRSMLLIVDDEKPTREGLRAALEDRYDVYLAEDAAAATELLEKEHFNVLLTDRSEEHTSELQSRGHLVCRLLPEKQKPRSPHALAR